MGRPIEKLTIKGFKSIRALEDLELRSLNILIGANGAGKSNFVSFFQMTRAMVRDALEAYIREHGGADAHLFLGPKVTHEIAGVLDLPPNRYGFTLSRTVRNELSLKFEYSLGARRDRGVVRVAPGSEAKLEDSPNGTGPIWKETSGGYVHQAVSEWIVYHFHDTSATAGARTGGTVRDYEALRPDAANLAAFLFRLHNENRPAYDLVRDTVRFVAPFFDDFKLRPQAMGQDEHVLLEWTQKGSDYPFHPSQLSDGTLRFICLATALLQPNPPSTMIIDEPELGLHPYALAVLAGLLKQAAARTQVIVSTQSATLLDHFEPEDVIVVDRANGASTFKRLEKSQLKEWLAQYSLGELWQKNVFEGGPVHE